MNERLIDYALNQLDPAERAEVDARLAADPALAAKLAALTSALAPLTADREPDAPPPGLALAAVAHTANFLVENGLFTTADGFVDPTAPTVVPSPDTRDRESRWLPISRVHANAAVAAGIAFLVVAFGVVGVQRVRREYQTAACQDNLRELHTSLAGYSDTHHGRYPQPGTETIPVAGSYLDELARSGQVVSPAARSCPITPVSAGVGYAYSLGYRDPLGRLTGLRKPESADDHTPILADLAGDDLRPAGHGGWNVLTVGGSVRLTTVRTIGVNGDDIFRNDDGVRRAGLHRYDVSLGHPFDQP